MNKEISVKDKKKKLKQVNNSSSVFTDFLKILYEDLGVKYSRQI